MILKIAWRNVWRSPVRSLVVCTAIALGLIAGLFTSALVEGIMDQRVESVIELEMSHLQFHAPDFRDYRVAQFPRPFQVALAGGTEDVIDLVD